MVFQGFAEQKIGPLDLRGDTADGQIQFFGYLLIGHIVLSACKENPACQGWHPGQLALVDLDELLFEESFDLLLVGEGVDTGLETP